MKRLKVFCACLCLIVGCSTPRNKAVAPTGTLSLNSPKEVGIRGSYNWKNRVEFYSVQDVATQEISKSPTSFPIAFSEDGYSWERAKLFLKNHTAGFGWNDEFDNGSILTSDAENNKDKFHYQIVKIRNYEGYRYTVKCYNSLHQETSESILNAKNLARFIQKGELELELLKS